MLEPQAEINEWIVVDKFEIIKKIEEILEWDKLGWEGKEKLYNLKRMSNRLKWEALLRRANKVVWKDIFEF